MKITKYAVFTGCRNGFIPDTDDYSEFETIKELREYLRELKHDFANEWKISVECPLSEITHKNLKKHGSMCYFTYQPHDASDYYIPYMVAIEYVAPNYCPKCGEHFFVHENGCIED